MLRKLRILAKHKFRLSPLSYPYWSRRRRRMEHAGTFAQHGEDKIILEKCGSQGIYIDIGANHPFLLSNTYLLYKAGWQGVTVEPIRSLWHMHKRWRPRDITLNSAVGTGDTLHFYEICPDVLSTLSSNMAHQIEQQGDGVIVADYDVAMIPGQEIVDKYLSGRKVNLLSVDVEGAELGVLQTFDFNTFDPEYILIEHHSFIPDTQATKAIQLIGEFGYVLDQRIGTNSLFTRNREASAIDIG